MFNANECFCLFKSRLCPKIGYNMEWTVVPPSARFDFDFRFVWACVNKCAASFGPKVMYDWMRSVIAKCVRWFRNEMLIHTHTHTCTPNSHMEIVWALSGSKLKFFKIYAWNRIQPTSTVVFQFMQYILIQLGWSANWTDARNGKSFGSVFAFDTIKFTIWRFVWREPTHLPPDWQLGASSDRFQLKFITIRRARLRCVRALGLHFAQSMDKRGVFHGIERTQCSHQ